MDFDYTLSRKINKLFLIFGFHLFVCNCLFAVIYEYSLYYFMTHPVNIIVVCGLLWLSAWSYLYPRTLKYCHIIILSITAEICIISDCTQFSGIGQVIILTLILFKYDFLRTHAKVKLMLVSFGYIMTTEYSLMNSGRSGAGVEVYTYIVYFLIFLYVLYKTDLDRIFFENRKEFDDRIDSIQKEKEKLIREINAKEARIAKLNKLLDIQINGICRMDMEKYQLTNREKNVVHLLATRNMINRDIASHLKIKEGTVKSHFYHIFNKVGVDSRNELIGLYYSIDLGR